MLCQIVFSLNYFPLKQKKTRSISPFVETPSNMGGATTLSRKSSDLKKGFWQARMRPDLNKMSQTPIVYVLSSTNYEETLRENPC
jgi:hypothetical protein